MLYITRLLRSLLINFFISPFICLSIFCFFLLLGEFFSSGFPYFVVGVVSFPAVVWQTANHVARLGSSPAYIDIRLQCAYR